MCLRARDRHQKRGTKNRGEEEAKIGEKLWNRRKCGFYTNVASVEPCCFDAVAFLFVCYWAEQNQRLPKTSLTCPGTTTHDITHRHAPCQTWSKRYWQRHLFSGKYQQLSHQYIVSWFARPEGVLHLKILAGRNLEMMYRLDNIYATM